MGAIGELGMNIANQAAGGFLGVLTAGINDRRQIKQQQQLNAMQIAGQKEMGLFNYDLQKKMWDATNYEAQRKHMEAAGLSTGLMYGMKGGGGATTGSTSGGGPSGASAPTGGGEIMSGLGMGLQMALLKAQKENIEADTKNKLGDAANKPLQGANIQASTNSLTQGVENQKAIQELTVIQQNIARIDEEVKGATQNAAKAMIMQEVRSSYEKMEMLKNEKLLSDATLDEKIKIIEREAVGALLRNAMTRASTANIQQGTEESKKRVEQINKVMLVWDQELALKWRGLSNDDKRAEIMKAVGDNQIEMSAVDRILDGINSILNLRPKTTTQRTSGESEKKGIYDEIRRITTY